MSMSAGAQIRIGYLPFYVDYYENICANLHADKL